MNFVKTVLIVATLGVLCACSTPQDRAAKAQEGAYDSQKKVADERLKLVNKYQDCVKSAGTDEQKKAACDSYLKAAESLK